MRLPTRDALYPGPTPAQVTAEIAAAISAHAALDTGVHGAGGDVLATDADIVSEIFDHSGALPHGAPMDDTLLDGSEDCWFRYNAPNGDFVASGYRTIVPTGRPVWSTSFNPVGLFQALGNFAGGLNHEVAIDLVAPSDGDEGAGMYIYASNSQWSGIRADTDNPSGKWSRIYTVDVGGIKENVNILPSALTTVRLRMVSIGADVGSYTKVAAEYNIGAGWVTLRTWNPLYAGNFPTRLVLGGNRTSGVIIPTFDFHDFKRSS